jgi:hypothetical protein
MVQTAVNISTEEQYLQIARIENQSIADDLSYQSAKTFDSSFLIENTIFETAAPFYYKTRVRLSLTVSGEFKSHLAMIRGLIEFNRSRHFLFDYRFKQGTIETDIDISQVRDLQLLLKKLSIELKQEIQFKHALKTVLAFERRYKLERESVYSFIDGLPLACTLAVAFSRAKSCSTRRVISR